MIRLCLITFFACLCFLASGQAEDIFATDKIALEEMQRFHEKNAFSESRNSASTDFIYQRMKWEIDPAVNYISGEIQTYFKSQINQLNKIEFDLSNELTVDSIYYQNTSVDFDHQNNKILVSFSQPLLLNQIDSVTIFYQGTPPSSGFGSFVTSTHSSTSTPILWTLSEPYGAMEWWPCKQSLSDKIDSVDIIVTTPNTYRTAGNGILITEELVETKRITHWKHRYPIATYLIAIAVTDYQNYSHYVKMPNGDSLEILNYVYPEYLESAQQSTLITVKLIELFNELIGPYPFAREKYGHAQFGWGGGMEHQTMSFMGSFGFGLIAHELAHQWFGDCITLGSWHDIWLNEGFATYLTGLSYENILPFWWPVWKETYTKKIKAAPDGAVFVEDTTSVSRIFNSRLSYAKGAYILHMLRWIIGDDLFFSGLKNYFSDTNITNGFARSEDVIHHFESVADTSLQEFFDDWLYGEGYPVYSLSYVSNQNGSYKLILNQQTTHSSVDFFEMPVPVRLYNATNTDSLDLRLNHTSNQQEFWVTPGFEIASVKIDPDLWLVSETDQVVGTESSETREYISIYPNPVQNVLKIISNSQYGIESIRVLDINGRILNSYNKGTSEISTMAYKPGTYFLELKNTKTTIYKRFIKH